MARFGVVETSTSRILFRDGKRIAADTPVMRAYYARVFRGFHGRVLVAGYGLGTALEMIRAMPEVSSAVCVEIDPDLVREGVVLGDIWDHSGSYDCAFFDIWSEPWDKQEEARKLESRGLAKHQISLPLTY